MIRVRVNLLRDGKPVSTEERRFRNDLELSLWAWTMLQCGFDVHLHFEPGCVENDPEPPKTGAPRLPDSP